MEFYLLLKVSRDGGVNCSTHKKENVLSSLTKLAITPTDCCAINPGLTTSGILLIRLVLFQRLISRIN